MMTINLKLYLSQLVPTVLLLLGGQFALHGQSVDSMTTVDYTSPERYEIGGITVSGAYFSDEVTLISLSGLEVGGEVKVPGPEIQRAVRRLLRLRIFSDVEIHLVRTVGDIAFLEIVLQEAKRLSRYAYRGVKKNWHDDLNDEVGRFLRKGSLLNEANKQDAINAINQFFIEKGYWDVETQAITANDTTRVNALQVIFDIDKGERTKIAQINFQENEQVKDRVLRKRLTKTKERSRFLASSKLIRKEYEMDKKGVIAFYQSLGYRDAVITRDSIWRDDKGQIRLDIWVDEGQPYYLGSISWKGNSRFSDKQLDQVLGMQAGDLYNNELLQERLSFSADGSDLSTLYMDDGYLFFNVQTHEKAIREDTVDLEIRLFEGPIATIDKVTIAGNDRTNEHVIRRELRTRPGNKFSRSDIIRSQRELINMGYFNPENLGINTPVNPQNGTVDIEYTLEERPSDQLELSAGWGGAGQGVIGTLGFTFSNFSLRNLRDRSSWAPLPQGDGQRVSIRAQSNGRQYQSINLSFTEPWLGGRKPNSFTVAGFLNRFTNGLSQEAAGLQEFYIGGVTLSLGTRLRWPDDFFVLTSSVNLQQFSLNNWSGLFVADDGSTVSNGIFNNFSLTQTISRNSIDNPLFPTRGSSFSLSLQLTPPYSLFSDRDYETLSNEERFEWIEYHKWRFNAAYYAPLAGKLTLKIAAKLGFQGYYNEDVGFAPFERFLLGGDGLNNQNLGFQGTDIISLRGYEINDLEANFVDGRQVATPLFQKFTVEARYPLSTNPNSTIYALAFVEAGNSYRDFDTYNPFEMRRSFGVGARVYLPMFGLLGFDYGIGVDNFQPGQSVGNLNVILGFEPE